MKDLRKLTFLAQLMTQHNCHRQTKFLNSFFWPWRLLVLYLLKPLNCCWRNTELVYLCRRIWKWAIQPCESPVKITFCDNNIELSAFSCYCSYQAGTTLHYKCSGYPCFGTASNEQNLAIPWLITTGQIQKSSRYFLPKQEENEKTNSRFCPFNNLRV